MNTKEKSLTQLAKIYTDSTNKGELFAYCVESFIVGQKEQCREIYKKMTSEGRRDLLTYLYDNAPSYVFQFYFNI